MKRLYLRCSIVLILTISQVNAGLNSDDFLKNVAVHLASQLQPTLKANLDLSAIETKFLTGNEQLVQRIDESKTETASKLEGLSSLIDISNTTSTSRISAIEAAITQINTSIAGLGNNLKALQEQVASPDTTLLSSHTSKLDTIAAGLQTLQDEGPTPFKPTLSSHTAQLTAITTELESIQKQIASPDTSLLSSHTTRLDAITSDLLNIKENTDNSAITQTITSDLASIKSEIEAGHNLGKSSISDLQTQLASILSDIETQSSTLAELKNQDVTPRILEKLNEYQTTHTRALSEIKSEINGHTTTLKQSNETQTTLASVFDAIKTKVESHTSTLDEIKAATASIPVAETVDLLLIESSLKDIATNIQAQNETLAEIKSATLRPLPIPEKTDLTNLETSLQSVITGIESQNGMLAELKNAATAPAPESEKIDLTAIETSLGTIVSSVESQQITLSEIKTATETFTASEKLTDINTSFKTITSAIDHQNDTLSTIKNSSSLTSDILAAVTAHDAILGEIKTTTSAPVSLPDKVDLTYIETSVKEIITSIDAQNGTLSDLKASTAAQDTVLGEIKEPSIDILSNVKILVTNLSDSKDEVITKIEEVKPLITAVRAF